MSVQASTAGRVRILTLDRPEARNALDAGTRKDLIAKLKEAEQDPAVGAIVLTGAGTTFAAGADLKELLARSSDEQLHFLLERMQRHRSQVQERVDSLRLARASTRHEVFRRIGYATDFMQTHYARSIDLDEIAKVACLSKYHFLRLFALVHGMTPFSYLQRKRARVALRLLRTTAFTVAEVACSVGFGQRTTVLRQIRRWTGLRPLQIRTAGVSR